MVLLIPVVFFGINLCCRFWFSVLTYCSGGCIIIVALPPMELNLVSGLTGHFLFIYDIYGILALSIVD